MLILLLMFILLFDVVIVTINVVSVVDVVTLSIVVDDQFVPTFWEDLNLIEENMIAAPELMFT